jgi:hypothetical protein
VNVGIIEKTLYILPLQLEKFVRVDEAVGAADMD